MYLLQLTPQTRPYTTLRKINVRKLSEIYYII